MEWMREKRDATGVRPAEWSAGNQTRSTTMANKHLFGKKTATKAEGKGGKARKAPKTKATTKKKEGLSMIDAAKKVLAEKGEAMSCKDMIEAMASKALWKSPGGLTPHNTLYSAILRLLQRDGKNAAFRKEDRGLFSLNPSAQA
jgi:hypothetical protein